MKFLAITASNLDEFFMKRIGGLKQQAIAGMQELTDDGRTPQQQIAECLVEVRAFEATQRALLPVLLKRSPTPRSHVLAFDQLSPASRPLSASTTCANFSAGDAAGDGSGASVPVHLQSVAESPGHAARPDDIEPSLARVKVPVGLGIPRFLRVEGTRRFVPLEDVIAHTLDLLFPEARVDGYEFFRVTRNANTERDKDEADDLLALIEIRAARSPLRADRADGSRARHETRASRDARGGTWP